VIEHREMDPHGNPVIRRLPGAAKWPDVTLTHGLGASDELWRWRQSVVTGAFAQARADCTIEFFDQAGNLIAAFHLKQAWPASTACRTARPAISPPRGSFSLTKGSPANRARSLPTAGQRFA
jgi:phage tail-like protein